MTAAMKAGARLYLCVMLVLMMVLVCSRTGVAAALEQDTALDPEIEEVLAIIYEDNPGPQDREELKARIQKLYDVTLERFKNTIKGFDIPALKEARVFMDAHMQRHLELIRMAEKHHLGDDVLDISRRAVLQYMAHRISDPEEVPLPPADLVQAMGHYFFRDMRKMEL